MAETYNQNAGGSVHTLVGNWDEEAVLKASAPAASTFERVIWHSEHTRPAEWATHSSDAFRPPHQRSDPASYTALPQHGPAKVQELERMWQQAAQTQPPPPLEHSFDTTHRATFVPQRTDGIELGARVMRTRDGGAVTRDPTFLMESRIMPAAGRLMRRSAAPASSSSGSGASGEQALSAGGAGCTGGTGGGTQLGGAAITVYSAAAAGVFSGTAAHGKAGLMHRNDQFSKPIHALNKDGRLL